MSRGSQTDLSFIDDIVQGSGLSEGLVGSAEAMSQQLSGEEPGVLDYLSEAYFGAGKRLGEAAVTLPTMIKGVFNETVLDYNKYFMEKKFGDQLDASVIDAIGEAAATGSGMTRLTDFADEQRIVQQARERSAFADSDIWIKPDDIAGVIPSVVLGAATVALGGAPAPVTVPMLAAAVGVPSLQAADGLYGEYARTLAENPDMRYDPKVGAALGLVVAVEAIGTKATAIDLPKLMATKAFRRAAAAEAKGQAKKGIGKAILAEAAAAGVDGIEEVVEEEMEALVTILYEPEFAELREAISSGNFSEADWSLVWEKAKEVDVAKTFLLGAGSYGVTRPVAGVMQSDRRAEQKRKQTEEIARDVRRFGRGEVTAGEDIVDEAVDAAEDVAPEDVEPADGEALTVADFDSDAFMDRLVAENPEAVEEILSKPRSRGNTKAAWVSVLPEDAKTNRAERTRLYDRLKAARDRAAEGLDGEAEVEAGGDIVADLRREEERLTEELLEIESLDPDFADSREYQDIAVRLGQVREEVRAAEDAAVEADPEFSTDPDAPVVSKRVDAGTLEQEPGTQMGSMPGGMASQPSTGRRYYTKRYPNREQTRNEAVANRLYDAAGVRVPNISLLTENGEIVGVASEIVPGVRPGQPADAADGLVIDAWLANWDVVGMAGDNLLVDRDGNAVRIDQGGALTTRAQGAPKGEAFGNEVGEIETLPAMNEALANASPAQLRRGYAALESVSEQDIKRIVKENSTGDTAADNRLIATLIKRRRDLLSKQDQVINAADAQFSAAAADLELQALNAKGEDTFERLTPDEEANLTDGERQIAENARKRLGREVVFVKQTGGTARNGFILNRNDDSKIYLVVPSDTQAAISAVAEARGISEREVAMAYESVLLQTLLHENYHLSEGRDGEELTEEERLLRADAHTLLKYGVKVGFNNRIRSLYEAKRAGVIDSETLAGEVRAELATDLVALQRSGVEALFLDRGRLRNAMSRLRMLANRLGGPKDVKVINRIVRTMDRAGETSASYPGSVETTVEYSTDRPTDAPSSRPGYNAEAGYAGNKHVPAIAYRNATAEEVAAAHSKNTRDEFLTPVDPDELNGMIERGEAIARISNDGTSGFILKKMATGWDVTGVFNVGDIRGAGRAAVIDAIALGGTMLDCYDGYLGLLYPRFGFAPTHRMKFNREFAPDNWNYKKYKEPDVVLMTYAGGTRDKQAIADLVGYYGDNYDKRQAVTEVRGQTVQEWPSESERVESRDVEALRQGASRGDDAASRVVRRVLNPEFSTTVGDTITSPVPYLDLVRVQSNPTPEGVLELFANYRAFSNFKGKKKPQPEQVMAEMAKVGLDPNESIASFVSQNYLDEVAVTPPATLVGESEQFGPRGAVETELSKVFDRNPSPTADELAAVKGAPSPRTPGPKTRGLVVVQHKYKKSKTKTIEESSQEFIDNVKRNMEAAGATVAVTSDDNAIESLIKKNDVVIHTGGSLPSVHIQPAFMDRNKQTRSYGEIKAATIEAVEAGLHNWYREFGMAFADISGPDTIAEAAFIFGVTSAQSPVEVNMGDTLFIMKAVREHKRLGKPMTVEAIVETLRGKFGKAKKGKKPKRVGVGRKNKYTQTGEMKGFFTDEAAEKIAQFYIEGIESSEHSLKVRTYAGGIAEGSENNFYPFSVQDRHQAAMYGFLPGKLDPETGELSNDKKFTGQYEYRYAAYLTQRLSMEPELVGLTPSMVQSAQWFHVKSGKTMYSDADVKENAGLLLQYEKANPDVTVGTIESALRFNAEEVAALRAELALSEDNPVLGRMVPGFTSFKNGVMEYSAGQAEARRLSAIMENNAARVAIFSKPSMQGPGLSSPAISDAANAEMMQNILSAVTESDGSIRLLNEMGVPHAPLTSVNSSDAGGQSAGLHLTPLLGSISDPAAAKVIGAIIGLGTIQPRMASIQPTPNGSSVTLRIFMADQSAMSDQASDRVSSAMTALGKPGQEVISNVSPTNGFIEVTVVPSKGRVENDSVTRKFDRIAKELKDEAGIEVRAEAHRSEVEVTDQSEYAEIVGSSGLAAGDPQGLLRRVLGEITVPTLEVLRSNGYNFNRQQFAEGHGLEADVASAIPAAEFSSDFDELGLATAQTEALIRSGGNQNVIDMQDMSMGEIAEAEARWYASLDNDERLMLRWWASGISGGARGASDLLRNLANTFRDNIQGTFWTSMRILGTYDEGSLHADRFIFNTGLYDEALAPKAEITNDRDHREMNAGITKAINDGLRRAFDVPHAEGIPLLQSWGLFYEKGRWANREILYGPPMDLLGPNRGMEFIGQGIILTKAPDNINANEWSDNTLVTADDGTRYIVLGTVGTFNARFKVSDIVEAMSQKMGFGKRAFNYAQRQALAGAITAKLVEMSGTLPQYLKKMTPLYNKLLIALARAPKLKGEIYRGHFITRGEFASRFPVGSVFRTGAPASASSRFYSAMNFVEGKFAGPSIAEAKKSLGSEERMGAVGTYPVDGVDPMSVIFVIDTKSARPLMPATLRGDRSDPDTSAPPQLANAGVVGFKSYNQDQFQSGEFRAAARMAGQASIAGYSQEGIGLRYDRAMSEQIRSLVEQGQITEDVGADLQMLLEDAVAGVTDPQGLGLKQGSEYMVGPSNHQEHEAVVMPGTAFEVVSIDETSGVVRLREKDVDPYETADLPVFAEFSTTIGPADPAIEPEVSTVTWRNQEQGGSLRRRAESALLPVRRTVQDRFIELDYIQRDIEDAYGSPLGQDEDAIAKIRSLPGEVAHKAERFGERVVKPLATQIAEAGLTQAEMGEYAVAIHALDANRELRAMSSAAAGGAIDSGMSDEEANRVIDRMRNRKDIDIKQVDLLHGRLVGIGRQNLRMAKNAGLISQQQYDEMSAMYPNYVPMWNAFDPDGQTDMDGADQFTVPSEIFRARTGRGANSLAGNSEFFADRLAAMADQRFRVIRKGANNKILQRLLNLAGKVGDNVMSIYTPTVVPVRLKDGRIGAAPDNSWRTDPTIFQVMVGGKRVLLKVENPALAKAMRGANRDPGTFQRVMLYPFQKYSSLFRYFTTQFGNPDFTATNPVRDIQTGLASVVGENTRLSAYKDGKAKRLSMADRLRIVSRSGIQLINSWATVWGKGSEQSRRDYAKYRALGGRQGIYKEQDPVAARKALQAAVKKGTPDKASKAKNAVLMPIKAFAKTWEHVNTMFDDGIRFSVYRQLVREGVHPEKAVETARDLTVDFSRMGTAGPVVNTLYVYSNATVQGSTKTLRLMKTKAGASIVGAYFMAGILSELWNDDDEDKDKNLKSDWDEIPDYQRDADVHIRLPDGFGSDGEETGYLKFPVAYGLDVPFVFGRRLVRMLRGKETLGEASVAFINAAVTQFVPGGFGNIADAENVPDASVSLTRALLPDAIDPVFNLATNKDWLNHPIYNEPFPTDPVKNRSQMGRDQTWWGWKDTSELLNSLTGGNEVEPGLVSIQPEILPYILGQAFGGSAKTVDRLYNMYAESMHRQYVEAHYPDEAQDILRELDTRDIPIVRRFFTASPQEYDAKADYYKYKQISDYADGILKEYDKAGDYESAIETEDKYAAALSVRDYLKDIKALKKEMRDVKAEMKAEGESDEEIRVEMARYAAEVRELQREMAMVYREEEQYAETQAGTN